MEQNAQRELREVSPEWTLGELMARIAKALVSDGPALAFSSTSFTNVPPRISIVVKTTGSSGVAKEVGLSSGALLSSAKASHKFLGAEFGNTWSLLLPLTHIAGINVLIRSLELGTEPIDLRNHEGEYPQADFTAIENLMSLALLSGQSITAEEALRALTAADLADQAHRAIRTLSQGQKQRIALARLRLPNPKPLWILDEPFNALDQQSNQLLQSLLLAHVKQNGMVAISSHQALSIDDDPQVMRLIL